MASAVREMRGPDFSTKEGIDAHLEQVKEEQQAHLAQQGRYYKPPVSLVTAINFISEAIKNLSLSENKTVKSMVFDIYTPQMLSGIVGRFVKAATKISPFRSNEAKDFYKCFKDDDLNAMVEYNFEIIELKQRINVVLNKYVKADKGSSTDTASSVSFDSDVSSVGKSQDHPKTVSTFQDLMQQQADAHRAHMLRGLIV